VEDTGQNITAPEAEEPRLPIGMFVAIGCLLVFLVVSYLRQDTTDKELRERLGIIVAAGLTLTMYSFLYRDNVLFKIAENIYVGVGLGFGTVMTWYQAIKPEVYDPLFTAPDQQALHRALLERGVPIVLGIMLLTRLSRRFAWPSRYSFAIMIGWGSGINIPRIMHTNLLKQLETAVLPMKFGAAAAAWKAGEVGDFLLALAAPAGTLFILIGTVAVLYYFFFSLERGPVGKAVSRVGIFFLMVAFGASFGYTVMARLSLFIDRVNFLMNDWLNVPTI